MSDMQENVLLALSNGGKALIKRIEEFAGREVEFIDGITAEDLPKYAAPEGGGLASCRITEKYARVYLFGTANLTHAVTHELLHIERYWNEQIPQIESIGGNQDDWNFTSAVESTIEHLAIIPKEQKYGLPNWEMWGKPA